MINKIDSIIFDLDGTLWDSTAEVAQAWHLAAQKCGFVKRPVTQADVVSITGRAYSEIYDILFPELTPEQRLELMKVCAEEELNHLQKVGGTLYEGLEETLQYLQNKYKLFIVSNCQSGYIELFINHFNFSSYFTDMECFGSRNLPKAENIREIIRRNKLQRPVYIGDTQGDYTASKANNIPFVFCKYGFGKVEDYDHALEKVSDLQKIF